MARDIDDPSLERPRYVKGVRRLSQSTLQHVRARCWFLVSFEEKLPRVSLPAIFSHGYTYTARIRFLCISFHPLSSRILQVRQDFSSTELNSAPSAFKI